jgi:hypothetical protein
MDASHIGVDMNVMKLNQSKKWRFMTTTRPKIIVWFVMILLPVTCHCGNTRLPEVINSCFFGKYFLRTVRSLTFVTCARPINNVILAFRYRTLLRSSVGTARLPWWLPRSRPYYFLYNLRRIQKLLNLTTVLSRAHVALTLIDAGHILNSNPACWTDPFRRKV